MNDRYRHHAINVLIAITCLCILPLAHLRFDLNLEKLFPIHDPDTEYFQKFREAFHSDVDDNVLIIGLENSEGIFQKDFLELCDSLTKYISKLDHIIKIYSLTNSYFIYFNDNQFNAKPLIRISNPEYYAEDSIQLFGSKEFRDLLISKSGKSNAIAAFHSPLLSGKEKEILLNNIEDKINQLGFDKSHLTGKIKIEYVLSKEIKKNAIVYFIILLLIVSAFILIFYKSVHYLLILFLITGISTIWIIASMSLLNFSMDGITTLIPIIPLVLCISGFLYFINRYSEIRSKGLPKEESIKYTLQSIQPAIITSSLIIAISIFSLQFTKIPVLRSYACLCAGGVLLSALVTIIALKYYNTWSGGLFPDRSIKSWIQPFNLLFTKSISNTYSILGMLFVVIVLSVYFINKIEMNGKLADGISRNSTLWDDYLFIEHDFYGTRRFEMVLLINDPNQSVLDIANLKKTEAIESFLKDSCNLAYVISPLSLLKGANKAYKGGSNSYFTLPNSQEEVNLYVENIMQTQYSDELQRYLIPDGSKLRISGRMPDINSKEFSIVKKRFDNFFKLQEFDSNFSYQFTGSMILLDKLSFHLGPNLILAYIITLLSVFVLGFYFLRSCFALLICLLPWLTALLITTGLMGVFNYSFSFETAFIFPISWSSGILQLVYFIIGLKQDVNKGLSLSQVIKNTYVRTAKSILITNIVLIICFISLTTSGLVVISNIGLWVSVYLLLSTLLHFTLIPVILHLFYKTKAT